ncbi:MAG: hypothetical protein LBU27_09290 [Candidatus Peribacteria bacterium]|nr:hypothetical protein [Candidatus Peribacteria bacterium]
MVLVNEAILETLRNNNIPYSCVVPVVSCKKEYMERMKSRGNNEQFIQKMAEHFEEYITNNAQDEYAENIYTLQQGQYLSDLLKTLDIPLIEKIAI